MAVERTGEVRSPAVETAVASRTTRGYAIVVAAAAVLAGIALLATGSPVPPLGPVVLLTIAAGLCVNRFALFPSEHAATGEAAVLLAAVVGFRADAPYLGPLVVALLVGPLDVLHWEQRSFVRMAYNAGNRGLATLAAAGTLAGVQALVGETTYGWVLTVVACAAAFVIVDESLSVVLLRLHGETFGAAIREVAAIDVLVMPIALVGAAAGVLAGELGWWAAVLAVLPAAFVPEFVLSRARARAAAVRDLAALFSVIAILATIALVTPESATASLAILCVLAVLLGIEIAPGRRALVPQLVALVVVPACVLLDGDRLRAGAVIVALLATASSWWCEPRVRRLRVLAALAVATGAAVAAAQLALDLPRTTDGLALTALAAGVAFELVALVASADRRRRGVALAWMAPVLAVAVAGGAWWASVGEVGGIVVAALLAVALVGWAGWGTPAWRSRIALRSASALHPWWFLVALGSAASFAVLASAIGASSSDHSAAAWAWTGAGFGEAALAMVSAGVRQWRFAPWPRRRGIAVVLVGAVLLVGAGAPLAARGSAWGPVVVAVTLLAALLAARAPARRLRDTADDADQGISVP